MEISLYLTHEVQLVSLSVDTPGIYKNIQGIHCVYNTHTPNHYALRWGVLDTTLCDKVCQWLVAGRWFSPVSSTNKTDCHNITEIIFEKKNDHLSIVVYYYTYLKTNKIIGKCHIKVNRLYSIQVDRVDIILNVLLLFIIENYFEIIE
jgi:hypothetical protein